VGIWIYVTRLSASKLGGEGRTISGTAIYLFYFAFFRFATNNLDYRYSLALLTYAFNPLVRLRARLPHARLRVANQSTHSFSHVAHPKDDDSRT
jgi:hypothetical protein